ncbi:uncharacterized protein [Cherax quadricarinatus]|uniref:uncharacterized protein isoform X2 n=1 Tax=Cherax quadricarinatus TaxID=27406 RepID=UPI0023792AB0|nr:uncharacterized protein LOC128692165 isoform X2 [Cherax quadricarinatus]
MSILSIRKGAVIILDKKRLGPALFSLVHKHACLFVCQAPCLCVYPSSSLSQSEPQDCIVITLTHLQAEYSTFSDNEMDGDDAIKTPIEEVSGGWLHQLVVYAARNPWEFCWYLLLCLSPMFFISAILSWKLAKALEAQEKDKNRRDKRKANISKVKRGKAN